MYWMQITNNRLAFLYFWLAAIEERRALFLKFGISFIPSLQAKIKPDFIPGSKPWSPKLRN
jgi:hypothetical protein